ncbi:MAG: LysE family translocator [Gammaproteobacteria bacterium]
MEIEILIAFIIAASLILAAPGPTVVLVVALAAQRGRGAVLPLAAGVLCGDLTAMLFSFAGLGALLAASAEWFAAFKWAAAACLIYLGIKQWRAKPAAAAVVPRHKTAAELFWKSCMVTAINPKGIVFFTVFMPQFISPAKPAAPQFAILGAAFLLLAALNAAGYAAFAGKLRGALQGGKARRINRLSGGALIGAGIWAAGIRRGAEI